MPGRVGDNAEVVLPRWFVVILIGALTAGVSAFLRVSTQLTGVEARLAVIEYRLSLPVRPGTPPWPGVQIAPPASADSL